jgi:hypothetical protein
MPRTKSRSGHTSASSRKTRASRGNGTRQATRSDDATKMRRYLDFVRAIVGASGRNGR